jgi:hypothetical protein
MQTDTSTPTPETTFSPFHRKLEQVKRWLITLFAGLGAGLVAGLVSVVCMLALRLWAGIPTPVELFGDFVLKRLPAPRFVDMLVFFSPNSKIAPLGLTLLGMLAIGTLLGLLYTVLVRLGVPVSGLRPGRREWLVMLAFSVVLSVGSVVLFWDESRQNFLGLPVDWARLITALGLCLDFTVYALVLGWCSRALLPRKVSAEGKVQAVSGRRGLLVRTSIAALGIGATGGALSLVRSLLNNYASYDGMKTYSRNGITSPITPNNEHYVVTQNPIDPSTSLNVWRLEMSGLVGTSACPRSRVRLLWNVLLTILATT